MRKCPILIAIIAILLFSCEEESYRESYSYLVSGDTNQYSYTKQFGTDYNINFTPPVTYIEQYIDINSDQWKDFAIIVNLSSNMMTQYMNFSIAPMHKNASIAANFNNKYWADTLVKNQIIDRQLIWKDTSLLLSHFRFNQMEGARVNGLWNNTNNKYLALRMYNKIDTLYAWLQIEITNYNTIKINKLVSKYN